MRQNRLAMVLAAIAAAGFLGSAGRAAAAADPSVAHIDGYLTVTGRGERVCMQLRQHDGQTLGLFGRIVGLRTGDHVRLEGRFADRNHCGARGFEVTLVQTLWGDDNHRTTLYDHLNGGSFERFAVRTGRIAQSDLGLPGHVPPGLSGAGDDSPGAPATQDPGEAPHAGTLEGRLAEARTGCPVLRTAGGMTYRLAGSLGPYKDGDWVLLAGPLYQVDPGSPEGRCGGGATMRIEEIRGK